MIIGNWKMNTLRADALAIANAVMEMEYLDSTRVGICPPALWIDPITRIVKDSPILVGAQDCLGDRAGAHTGCINADMIRDAGCSMVILATLSVEQGLGRPRKSWYTVAAVLETGMFPLFVSVRQKNNESRVKHLMWLRGS